MNRITREIEFSPAWDKRDPDPHKNYGIHGVKMRWYVKGPHGAVQFLVLTNWQLPHVWEEQDAHLLDTRFPHLLCRPMGADLGYHSPTPHYEGQKTIRDDCHVIGGPCYYDGSGLAGKELLEVLIAEGGEAVWARMEAYYRETFADQIAAADGGQS